MVRPGDLAEELATNLPIEKGEATFRFDFGWSGRYLVTFTYRDDRGRNFTSATIYQVSSRRPNEEGERKENAYQILSLAADRPAYEPGQTARIALRPKRPVSCYLVTLEQKGLLQHRVVTARKELPDMEIPIQAEFAPNVYVSVLALTPGGSFRFSPAAMIPRPRGSSGGISICRCAWRWSTCR